MREREGASIRQVGTGRAKRHQGGAEGADGACLVVGDALSRGETNRASTLEGLRSMCLGVDMRLRGRELLSSGGGEFAGIVLDGRRNCQLYSTVARGC